MANGDRADFWRTVGIGRRLRKWGWRAHGASIDRFETTIVDGVSCRWAEGIDLGASSCHRWGAVWRERGKKLPEGAAKRLRFLAGAGPVSRDPKSSTLRFKNGFASIRDLDDLSRRPSVLRKVPDARSWSGPFSAG